MAWRTARTTVRLRESSLGTTTAREKFRLKEPMTVHHLGSTTERNWVWYFVASLIRLSVRLWEPKKGRCWGSALLCNGLENGKVDGAPEGIELGDDDGAPEGPAEGANDGSPLRLDDGAEVRLSVLL